MKLIRPSIEFLNMTEHPLEFIEKAGRTCYKSEDRITKTSAKGFVQNLLQRGHLAMIEHAWASYRVICDRGVTHEIVRHRLFSYAQESTRYCNYKSGVTFIIPCWFNDEVGMDIDFQGLKYNGTKTEHVWRAAMQEAEHSYRVLLNRGWTPQQARGVLPNALKTEIVITGNLREWLHFFTLRTAKAAHPQMQEIANMLLIDARSRIEFIFSTLSTQGDKV